MVRNETSYIYSFNSFFVFFTIAVLVTIWQVFNRKKAIAYLVALESRVLYLSFVFLLSQIGGLFENDQYKFIWLGITIVLFVFGAVLHFKFDKKYWLNTLAEWEEIDKMNVAKGYFRICEAFHSHSQASWEDLKMVYTIIPAGTVILTVVMGILGNNFKIAFLHFVLMGLGYFCIFMLGRIIAWIIEIRKLEKQLGVTFVTEFGMQEEQAKGKRRRKH